MSMKRNILAGILFLCIGVGLIAGSLIYKQSTDKKLAAWPHANAVVVDYDTEYKRDNNGDREIMYTEILEFEVDGKTYRVKSTSSSNIRPLLGTTREIAYDPVNPKNFVEKSTASIALIIFIIVGAAFAVGGPVLIVTSFVKRKK